MNAEELQQIAAEVVEENGRHEFAIDVCMGTSCLSQHSDRIRDAIEKEAHSCGKKCHVRRTGCMGPCAAGPMVVVEPAEIRYGHVHESDAKDIVAALGSEPVARLDPNLGNYFEGQNFVVLENVGHIDPEKIEEYVGRGGYEALIKVLTEMNPASVIEQIAKSGLRGRGGGGYPTGLKWDTVAKVKGPQKYVICNGDEGDPGAFMDRSVLESDPQRVIEGMAIAAFAIGATKGYIYVRAEYPLAVQRLNVALQQARRRGFLGNGICDTTFSFDIDIRLGAGAFVCGEETALIASIEGKRGMPRPRPPYPAVSGLWGAPTLINNVETFANVPPIIRHGGEWFSSMGTARSKGTKVFALTGKIRRTGLVEVPMGMTLRQIIFGIGGGVPEGRKFKAVQTGGPSGGCLPEEHLDLSISYDALISAGSMMGSGGMIVMDDTSCMVSVARFFMEFCMTESCGKCVPCRAGTVQMYELLTKICKGEATHRDLDRLVELCEVVGATSLCGLGQTAPNPVLSTLRYFKHEYLAHIDEKRCPAGVCECSPAEKPAEAPHAEVHA
ncbi:MAG TPA: NuoF family protein [Acidobacteriaceae bacterium]|nr:NuoF family protein [Acidobacteriaceae bacterium]